MFFSKSFFSNYRSICKNIEKCDIDFVKGLIKWDSNWVSFIDSILQLRILSAPTRSLIVLNDIRSVTIVPKLFEKDSVVPYEFSRFTDTIR